MTRDPQTTEALEMTAGALMMVFFSVCACIGAVGAVLFRAYMRRMDAFGQQNVALGQKVDALGQKIDVKGENIMEQKGDEKMQEIDALKTQIHDLKQTMENMKAFITQIDGLQPERHTADAPGNVNKDREAMDSRFEIEIADTVDFQDGRFPGARGEEETGGLPSFMPSDLHPAAAGVQQTDAAVGPRFPFSCAPCDNTVVVSTAVPVSLPASSTQ
jgi:hypothetical protein